VFLCRAEGEIKPERPVWKLIWLGQTGSMMVPFSDLGLLGEVEGQSRDGMINVSVRHPDEDVK
jgi:hypothetical protein